MIVEPDFLTHWKTELLCQQLGAAAPIYVIALWGHCQRRKTDRLCNMDHALLAMVCRCPSSIDSMEFMEVLLKCRFIEQDGNDIIVHDWAKANATLVGRWRGGEATQSLWSAKAKPMVSQGDKTRLDKIRVEKNKSTPLPPKGGVVVFPENLKTIDFKAMWEEWEKYRKEKREPLTPIGRKAQIKMMSEWGVERAIRAICHTIFMGWTGLREPNENNGSNKGKQPAVLTKEDYEKDAKRVEAIRQNATNRAANS